MKLHQLWGGWAAVVLVTAARAASFEGWVYSTLQDGKNGTELVYAIKGERLRIEMPGEKGGFSGAAIMDPVTQRMTVIMPDQKMAMVMPMQQAVEKVADGATGSDGGTWEKTGEQREILGYLCSKYIGTTADGRFEVWATEELGRFVGPGSLNPMQRKRAKGWEQMLAGQDFFPLEMTGYNRKGKPSFSLMTTKVVAGPLDDGLFTVPSDYQTMDMGAMMGGGGMGGGLNPFGK